MHVGQGLTSVLLPHPILPELEQLTQRVASLHGFELCGIQLLTHLNPITLQVQIRHTDGADVNLDDCAGFSGVLGEALEESQLLIEAYVLEISSPGIGEQLSCDRDFQTFRGFPVDVTHRDQQSVEHRLEGLHERNEDALQINIRGRIKSIPRDQVIEVRLTTPGQ